MHIICYILPKYEKIQNEQKDVLDQAAAKKADTHSFH